MSWLLVLRLLRLPRPRLADLVVLVLGAGLLWGLVALAPAELRQVAPSAALDLRPQALPGYAGLSLLRMAVAYTLSLVFTLIVGYAAARNPAAERILIPVLDILQSIPVLSFLPAVLLAMIALFPGRILGLELASVLLLFTGMVWNMTFHFYHALLTIPEDLLEAARMLRLSWWQRFTRLELPAAAIGLVWNSMMSWAGGWFFLMACENFTLVHRSFTLPGLGSYLAEASSRGDLRAVGWGLLALLSVIVALDQLVWRPLVAWSQKFKLELTEDLLPPRSWFLDLLRHSTVVRWVHARLWVLLTGALDRSMRFPGESQTVLSRSPSRRRSLPRTIAGVLIVGLAAGGAVLLTQLIARVPSVQWQNIALGAGATTLRVAIALLLAGAWAIPVGVTVGLRPRVARVVQPLAQMAASVPATALFPVVLLLLLRLGGGLEVASVALMLLGTQWYILFNVIAGTMALPRDLLEAAQVLRLRGWLWWRKVLLPALFPYLVTGGLSAQGGAWNASIVSEFITFGGRTLRTTGLGALIASAATQGDMPLLAASTVAMAAVVVGLNRLVWRRLAHLAETRYHV
ncbi:MAG: ABC transporter permease subunit [Armatimonadota bacterium]|nr:ABC transporter permease subunit [Armatimonadota bacterium]MDR7440382.1 ABC transporter permease subunit [Armatimonadota bacterium]MDR7444113.1 ABC transporter permease subunit [Armatimonadota bacterium]MDR7569530.1 ABC transporter permease subunit [Armatimonadota bacterium]MDR7613562.1 ABC transporter permease subunit [Armatimonadota bacterium]